MNEGGFGRNRVERHTTLAELLQEFDSELMRVHKLMKPHTNPRFFDSEFSNKAAEQALKSLRKKLVNYVPKSEAEQAIIGAKLEIIKNNMPDAALITEHSQQNIPTFEEGHDWQACIDETFDNVDELYKVIQLVEDKYQESNDNSDLNNILIVKANAVQELQTQLKILEYLYNRLPPVEKDIELPNYTHCKNVIQQALRDFDPLQFLD